jgi:hypothetical protein
MGAGIFRVAARPVAIASGATHLAALDTTDQRIEAIGDHIGRDF